MTLFLTGSPTRYGQSHFTADNGFLARVMAELPDNPRVLLVSAAPDDVAFTDSVMEGMSSGSTPRRLRTDLSSKIASQVFPAMRIHWKRILWYGVSKTWIVHWRGSRITRARRYAKLWL